MGEIKPPDGRANCSLHPTGDHEWICLTCLESKDTPAGHAAVIAHLTAAGVRLDVATMYADAFTDYQEAVRNIREHGAIVAHPRTHNPMPNPYLDVRDRARATLQKLNVRQGAGLWRNE